MAKVDDGTVTAEGVGEAVITVTIDGRTAEVSVKVEEKAKPTAKPTS